MMNRLTAAGLTCALALGASVTGLANVQGGTAKPSTQKPATEKEQTAKEQASKKQSANADATFMREAAMSSMAEIEHGRAAAANAANEEVRKFGQRMVDDHSKANDELKGVASKKQVTLPTELDQKHRAMQQKLEKMKGAEFDRAYMQHMVQSHKQAVTRFQQEAKGGKDAEARAWAEKTLPTVQEHLKMATEINGKVGKGGKQ
jgi:putative membrane protein